MAVCPFRMVAGLLLEAQKTKIAAVGVSESRAVKMDLGCIGSECMLFIQTSTEDKNKGACAPTLGAIKTVANENALIKLNTKFDTAIVATVEGLEMVQAAAVMSFWGKAAGLIAKAFRKFIGEKPEPEAPAPPSKKPTLVKED